MHIHWYKTVKELMQGRYMQCRCGHRKIHHWYLNVVMDYSWLKTGKFTGYGEVPVRSEN